MEIKDMTFEDIEARKAEIRSLVESAEDCDVEALSAEVDELEARAAELKENAEARKGIASRVAAGAGIVITDSKTEEVREMPTIYEEFRDAKKMNLEMRSVLVSSGKLATPTAVSEEIAGLPEVISSIVDDVEVIDATGTGAWEFPYKKTGAVAANVTEGQAIAGTASTYDKVTVNPSVWGVLDEVSNQVAKMTPVNYFQAVRDSAYLALRKEAKNKITAAILASNIAETRNSIALDQNYVRDIVLGFDADESVASGTKLYINKHDLAVLGKVRGTGEKKPVFEITFTDENNGQIKDGGTVVNFSINSSLENGVQLYGQPKTVKLLLWDNYEVSTDDGGDYFKRNMLGVRGLQTAGSDLCAYHGMQIIKQAAA